jgi:tetratricopeptide (TPR) repeat protein
MTATCPIEQTRATLRSALEALERSQAEARPWALAEAHRRVALAYAAMKAWPSALAMLEAALRWARAVGAGDQVVDLLCSAVEMHAAESDALELDERGSGRLSRERARDLVFETTRLAARVADPRWEVTVLLRLSDVLDRFGDRDDATQLQVRALQLTVGGATSTPPGAADASPSRRH